MGLRSLTSIVTKNFKIFFRSRFSSMFVLLFPLVIVLFAGFMFNSFALSGVVIGTYSEGYTDLTENILTGFEEQNYGVERFALPEHCTEAVKSRRVHLCVIFPGDLAVTGSTENILFHVDHSRINLAYNLINDIESQISSEASNLGVGLAQDLIDVLEEVKETIPNEMDAISLVRDDMAEVIDDVEAVSVRSDLDYIIADLNSIKADLNEDQQSIENDIDDVVELIEGIEDINSRISDDLDVIRDDNADVVNSLFSISSRLRTLLNSLNDQNVLEAEKIVSPIKTKIEKVGGDSTGNRDYFFPTLFTLIALFGGILLSSTLILRERNTKAYFRNFMTPAWDSTFILGSYITCLLILAVQFMIVFAGVIWILKMPLLDSLSRVSLILFLSLNVFIFIGMFLGYFFKSDETTVFSSVLVASVLMFFSNTIFPVESISEGFKVIAKFNPVVISEIALKKVMLFNLNYANLVEELYILGGFFLAFVILTSIGRKISKRRL